VERREGEGRAGDQENERLERTEPTLWRADQSENAKLRGELVACGKEKKSLNDLVRHIGETVIGHVKSEA
jgi:hypothetical protein